MGARFLMSEALLAESESTIFDEPGRQSICFHQFVEAERCLFGSTSLVSPGFDPGIHLGAIKT